MSWSQTFVVAWLQFAAAAALLLLAARLALRWIVQPAERIRLIQFTLAAALAVPLLLFFGPQPAFRLRITSSDDQTQASRGNGPTADPATFASFATDASLPPGNDSLDMQPGISREEPRGDLAAAVTAASIARPASPSFIARLASVDGWLLAFTLLAFSHAVAAAFLAAETIIGKLRLRRLVRSATSASDDVSHIWEHATGRAGRRVQLLVSNEVATPLTFGWWRPVVVIPRQVAADGGPSLRYCLAHEWSHIERADILAWHATWACQFALFYQPLFWTLRRELRVCQDILADSRSAGGRMDAVEYSELLVAFARKGVAPPVAGALTFLDHPSQLVRRVRMLLQPTIGLRSRCTWTFSLVAGIAAALACGLCTTVRLDSARAAEQATTQQDKSEKPAAAADKTPQAPAEHVPAYEQPAQLTYHCIVVDKESGQPIPNATVTVERSDSSAGPWPFQQIGKTTHVTDAEGKYTVEIPPKQSGIRTLYIQIYAEHDDHVRYSGGYSLSMIRKNETVGERPFFESLKLQPADRITGKIVSPTGEPLAGVKLFGFTTMKARDWNHHGWLDTKTQADGSFRLNIMKGGVGFFWALPGDYSIVQKFVSQGPQDLGEIRVPEGIRLSGRAISAEGQPVAGIAVNAYYQGKENEPLQPYNVLSGIRRGAITDANGRFTFDPLPPGEYRVVPEDELGDPRQERGLHPLPGVFLGQKTTLAEGVTPRELEIQAVPHINFHAQYLDSQGKKRSGSEFFITGRLDEQFWSTRARPDRDGAAFARLPHGIQNVQLGLITNEHSALRHRKGRGKPIENHNYNVNLGTLNDDVEGFEIIRYKAPLVTVQAIDEAGQPIKDFLAVAHYAWMRSLSNYIAQTSGSHVSFEKQDDGRQRTSQLLPDEEVTFTVSTSGYEPAKETLTLPEGEVKELVLTLKKTAETKPE